MSRLGINCKSIGMGMSLPREDSYRSLKLIALIERMIGCDNQDEERLLQGEFYNRFIGKFFERCHKITGKLYGYQPDWEAIRDDTIQESFLTAFEKINQFEMPAKWDDAECEKVILFWLAKIANNKLLKQLKAETEEKEQFEQYFYHFLSERSSGSIGRRAYEPTYDKMKFDRAWEKMNPMSKELLLLCLEYDTLSKADSEGNPRHLPDHVISALTKKYNVTKAALRKAKERALLAINSSKIEK